MTVSNGFGNYAAGSAKLEKRFSHGLQFLTAYTWSHALPTREHRSADRAISASPILRTGFRDTPSASWDIRHSFTTGFNYDVPLAGQEVGRNMNRAPDMLAGSWHSNGLVSLRTGVAYGFAG